jgi:DNA-binding LytR/AlgR family response regulator
MQAAGSAIARCRQSTAFFREKEAMHFTNRQNRLLRLATQLAIVTALGVFFAMSGPFGTYTAFGVGIRYAYWIGLCLIGYLNIQLIAHAVAAVGLPIRHSVAMALITLGSAVPTTFAVAWTESWLRKQSAIPLNQLPGIYLCVAAIQLMVLLFLTRLQASLRQLLLTRQAPSDAVADVPAQPDLPCRFMQRIPGHLGTDLLALGAEDHYLRIVTAQGSTLILMRLQDAIGELAAGKGMQVHRSWWVSFDAVTATKRDGGRTSLILNNQQEVPVSRTYLAEVRSAFGLKRNE